MVDHLVKGDFLSDMPMDSVVSLLGEPSRMFDGYIAYYLGSTYAGAPSNSYHLIVELSGKNTVLNYYKNTEPRKRE